VVPFIDNLACFWLTTGIKRWIRECRQSVNYWNLTKVKSWCGADTEMQGIGSIWLFDMQPTSVVHRAVLHIRYWADMRMAAKCRLLISDRDKKPISGQCRNARRLDIGSIWLFDMQPTSVRHRAVLHIRHENLCRPDVEIYIGPTSDRYKMFAGCS